MQQRDENKRLEGGNAQRETALLSETEVASARNTRRGRAALEIGQLLPRSLPQERQKGNPDASSHSPAPAKELVPEEVRTFARPSSLAPQVSEAFPECDKLWW